MVGTFCATCSVTDYPYFLFKFSWFFLLKRRQMWLTFRNSESFKGIYFILGNSKFEVFKTTVCFFFGFLAFIDSFPTVYWLCCCFCKATSIECMLLSITRNFFLLWISCGKHLGVWLINSRSPKQGSRAIDFGYWLHEKKRITHSYKKWAPKMSL